MIRIVLLSLGLILVCQAPGLYAQHEHGVSSVKAPKIFLDKSPRIVEYQLKRLSNEQLLAVETKTDESKYLPVFQAILVREGMSRAYRDEALAGMIAINRSNAVKELSAAIASMKGTDESSKQTIETLASMLLESGPEALQASRASLQELTSGSEQVAPVGYAALLLAGPVEDVWKEAVRQSRLAVLLDSIGFIPDAKVRSSLHDKVVSVLDGDGTEDRLAAIRALGHISDQPQVTFQRLANLVKDPSFRTAAIRSLLTVPAAARQQAESLELIRFLVNFAESTPAEKRTENSFLDAMELVDQLLGQAPTDIAKNYRQRLSETVVRVVRIHTVEEEMRYDTPFFAVEAGRPVQVVLINEDLMPHNLVICQPGKLKEVAQAGQAVGPNGGLDGKQYVPQSEDVLFATHMIASLESERLTFDAPTQPGEYPFVCTFPRHWMRMYGVMVVVEDLDAWLKNPIEPKDPIGSNRSFVQAWQVGDLESEIAQGLQGRSAAIGERIFTEATCAQCHKLGAFGLGNVGPDLSEAFAKFKGDDVEVLREILDPSHRIDDKYAVHLVLDADSQTHTGLLISDEKDRITLLEDPEAKEPTVILKDDIEQIVKTTNSMMPKGLMDRFSKDEIFELLSFLKTNQKK